jgi:hypothetical protein
MDEGGVHTIGSAFNAFFDGANAALWRLLELPLFVLLLGLVALFWLAWLALRAILARRRPGAPLRAPLVWLLAIFFVLSAALIADHKIVATLNEARALHSQRLLAGPSATDVSGTASAARRRPGRARGAGLYDEAQLARVLDPVFGRYEVAADLLHPGIEYVVLRTDDPARPGLVVHAFVVIVDLTRPELAIEITPRLGNKYLTSEFARSSSSIVAINGEAGSSPAPGSGFGEWTGPWIARGRSVAFDGDSERPFIGFARDGIARYYPEDGAEHRPAPGTWNAIWGRWDILREGVNLGLAPDSRKPRTIMGVNRSGDRLFLLVIAGGKPGYSLGAGLDDAASIVQAFGAWNAMACDEGGSSALYLEEADGIVSHLPGTQERPVYSHFGVSLREAG